MIPVSKYNTQTQLKGAFRQKSYAKCREGIDRSKQSWATNTPSLAFVNDCADIFNSLYKASIRFMHYAQWISLNKRNYIPLQGMIV